MNFDGNSEHAYSKLFENEKRMKVQIQKKRVTFENVKYIGYEINLRFRQQNINFKTIDNLLFESFHTAKPIVSIKDLIEIL